jgi:hypothetical protein
VEVASALDVPRTLMLVNKVPSVFDLDAVGAHVAEIYGKPVAAVLPHDEELMALASAGIFALRFPEHAITTRLRQVMARLLEG